MPEHDDLETRLSALSLAPPSAHYVSTGKRLLQQQPTASTWPWAVRLNYTLAATLLLSLGFNLVLLAQEQPAQELNTSQCEVGSNPASGAYSPARDTELQILAYNQRKIPINTRQRC